MADIINLKDRIREDFVSGGDKLVDLIKEQYEVNSKEDFEPILDALLEKLVGYRNKMQEVREQQKGMRRKVRERLRGLNSEGIFWGIVEKAEDEYVPLEEVLKVLEEAGFTEDFSQCAHLQDVVNMLWPRFEMGEVDCDCPEDQDCECTAEPPQVIISRKMEKRDNKWPK